MPPFLRAGRWRRSTADELCDQGMSYKVLARKWRPQHFDQMLGQEPVLRALINALDSDRLHHAYLFTGMRGVGKTTIARILAKCLNCLEKGVSSAPCGECSACKDIEAGRFIDLIEVDAASRTKVDETRELLENVPYAPASGRYKVYLIDEVHMFSTSSFNALLKTLEEPPEHVKFLLATTDPQKVPVTVLSRCLQFNLRRMAPDALADYLARLLAEEKIEAEPAALDLIARASEGSVRDSLSLVEQATAYGQGAVKVSEVETMLGRVSLQRLAGLLEALARGDVQTLFSSIEGLASYAPDFSEILGEILSLLHRLALMQSVPSTANASEPGHEILAQLAETVSAEEVQLWYQIGLHARRDLAYSPDPREAFDMAMLRMHRFRPQISGVSGSDAMVERGAQTEVTGRVAGAAQAPSASGSDASAKPASAATAASIHGAGSSAGVAGVEGLPVRGSVSAGDARDARALALAALNETGDEPDEPPANTRTALRKPMPGAAGTSVSASVEGSPVSHSTGALADLGTLPWADIVAGLGVSGMPRQLAANCVVDCLDDHTVHLILDAAQDHLNAPRFIERLAQALSVWSGDTVEVEVTVGGVAEGTALDTPSRRDSQNEADALVSAQASIQADQRLARLLEDVDGKIDPANVRPLTLQTD